MVRLNYSNQTNNRWTMMLMNYDGYNIIKCNYSMGVSLKKWKY